MSLDGFLTFFGLVIAAYAVLDPLSRLKLRLNAPIALVLSTVFVTIILGFQFILPILSILPEGVAVWVVGFGFGQPSDLLSNEKVSFLLTALWGVSILTFFYLSRPSGNKVRRLLPLTNMLYDERRYLELIRVLYPYIPLLGKYHNRTHALQKLHDWMMQVSSHPLPLALQESKDSRGAPRFIRPILRLAAKGLPRFSKRTIATRSIVETVAKSQHVRRELQMHTPEFAVEFFRTFQTGTFEEFDRFVMESMQNPESFLREDLRATINIQGETYALDPERVTLLNFVGDTDFALRSGVWRPVGGTALKAIREDKNYVRSLSEAPPFEDEDLFDDVTYSAIHFFDVLITRAATKEVQDNFWLMYVATFVEKILPVHDPSRAPAHYEGEFPTLGTRIVWEAQHRLENWVELSWRLSEANVHRTPCNVEEARDVCAIPYWAAHSLCRVVREVILSDNVSESFKVERLGSFVRTAAQIPQTGNSSYLREFLALGIIEGPFEIPFEDISPELKKLLPQTDHVHRSKFPELKTALEAR